MIAGSFHDPTRWLAWLSLFTWPFRDGLTGFVYYLLLNLCHQLTNKNLVVHLIMGVLAGCTGSLITSFDPRVPPNTQLWLLASGGFHGTIWGSLVGFGVWKSQQAVRRS